jgi:guanylate kinase
VIFEINVSANVVNRSFFGILDTSRMPRPLEENGKGYWFVDREDMEEEIAENNFLEFGEHNGNLYGTHLDSIRSVIKEGMNVEL